MKSLFKVAGIVLAAMFVVSMFASAAASAANPVWEQCETGSPAGTKYEAGCIKALSTGTSAWQEVKTTEKVLGDATLTLIDKKTTVGEVVIVCGGSEEGVVGPGKYSKVTKINVEPKHCAVTKGGGTLGCQEVLKVNGVNLPWQAELVEAEGKVLNKLNVVGTVGKEPGWEVECKTLAGNKDNICESEGTGKEEFLQLENRLSNSILLVLQTFEKKHKATCTEGGAEQGEVAGAVVTFKTNGAGLRA